MSWGPYENKIDTSEKDPLIEYMDAIKAGTLHTEQPVNEEIVNYKPMNIKNFRICYFVNETDAEADNHKKLKTAVVSSDDDGRINEAWILKGQITLKEGEVFILHHIERID